MPQINVYQKPAGRPLLVATDKWSSHAMGKINTIPTYLLSVF